ncbi:Protein FAR-RED IMPAIRED RESPONSE 1 [Linum perenne]
MFQEQYGRIQEYNMDTAGQTTVGTVITITVYKPDGNDRLDDRVVTANTYTGEVSCVCKYWDTMGLLCRHCLLVMFVQACNGHVAFRGLQERYIKKRWTRLARSGFFRVLAGIPRSISQVESERYITLHALFSAVVRISYREEILCRLLSKHAEMLLSYSNKGVEELTTLLQNGFNIQVQPADQPSADTNPSSSTPVTGEQPRRSEIAVKFPRMPKPSKNTQRYKVNTEIRQSKEKNKCKKLVARENALRELAEERVAYESIASFPGSTSNPLDLTPFLSSQQSAVIDD